MKNEVANQSMAVIKQTLARQNQQGELLIGVIEHVEEIEENVEEKFDEMSQLYKKVSDSVTLNEAECLDLKALVYKQSKVFTDMYFNERVNSDLYLNKLGQFRRAIWKHLKKEFHIRKYVHVKRIDFQKSMQYVRKFKYSDFEGYEIRMTPKQKELM